MKKAREGTSKKLHLRHDPFKKYEAIPMGCSFPFDEFSNKEAMRLLAKRYEELKARGYPDEWIEKDLKKLVEGI